MWKISRGEEGEGQLKQIEQSDGVYFRVQKANRNDLEVGIF